MADPDQTVATGDEIASTTSSIGLSRDAEFRTLSARLDEVTRQVSLIAKPKAFRAADVLTLVAIAAALFVSVFTALGLRDRIGDLVTAQTSSDTRLSGQINSSEVRLTARLDRLDDRITSLQDQPHEARRAPHRSDQH